MNFEILILLFVLFSVISSIISKLQHRAKREEREEALGPSRTQVPPYRRPTVPSVEREEIDLSEWDIFEEVQRSRGAAGEFREAEIGAPTAQPRREEEFREVRGTRQVEEKRAGEEFREIRGERPVSEGPTGAHRIMPARTLAAEPREERRRWRRNLLPMGRDALRKAIIYQEILGPPRADRMPW